MWLGNIKQLKTGSEDGGGSTGAGRAQTGQPEAGLCCCPRSPTSAGLKAGVALHLAPVPIALSIVVVGMSNCYLLKSVFVTVFERACALQAPSVLFAAEDSAPCWCHA